MKMKNNLYVSPSVEIIEVAVEAGIAASGENSNPGNNGDA